MPTPAQSTKVMLFNNANRVGKHRTLAEIEKRKAAAEKMARAEVKLKIPAFLKNRACDPALKSGKRLLRKAWK